ncbi:MAG: hypothetical protein Aurels2KO_45860 [Aureliella sp.]
MLQNLAIAVAALAVPFIGEPPASEFEALTPIVYGRSMFVCVSQDGVAAVRVLKPLGVGNESGNGIARVQYQWRFLPADAADGAEETGSGKILVNLKEGQATKLSSGIKCGPMSLSWQYKDQRSCLVGFNPERQSVYVFEEPQFGGLPGPGKDRPALELKTFQTEVGSDATSVKNPKARSIAALVSYKGTTTIVRGRKGAVVFEFGEVFNRERAPLEVQHGVKYSYTYTPNSGTVETGEGVLYELYKENQYDSFGSKLVLSAGPICITWSRGGDDDGFLYYDPSEVRIATCNTSDAPKLLRPAKRVR